MCCEYWTSFIISPIYIHSIVNLLLLVPWTRLDSNCEIQFNIFAKKLLKESSILWSIYFMKFTNDMMFYLMDIVCGSLCTIGESKDPQKNLLTFDSLFDVKWEHRAAVWKLICNNHKDKYRFLKWKHLFFHAY